eukprot:Hpha_TRINITY_DN12237_c0_g1::TRINITY_DN12237_c0_g1_i2::g.16798::m.16798
MGPQTFWRRRRERRSTSRPVSRNQVQSLQLERNLRRKAELVRYAASPPTPIMAAGAAAAAAAVVALCSESDHGGCCSVLVLVLFRIFLWHRYPRLILAALSPKRGTVFSTLFFVRTKKKCFISMIII